MSSICQRVQFFMVVYRYPDQLRLCISTASLVIAIVKILLSLQHVGVCYCRHSVPLSCLLSVVMENVMEDVFELAVNSFRWAFNFHKLSLLN